MNYKILLIDIDDTLLDFQRSEEIAIKKTMEKFNVDPNEQNVKKYKEINLKYWKMFERGEIEREALLIARFKEFFGLFKIDNLDFSYVNETYFDTLASVPVEIDGAVEFLEKLSKKYEIYAITNGVKRVQTRRLSLVNITKYFKKVFISEEVGFQKPNVEYFDFVLNSINNINKKEILIIGDSLTSDIQGGINSGIDTMWYNPKRSITDVKFKYQISNYDEFFEVIK